MNGHPTNRTGKAALLAVTLATVMATAVPGISAAASPVRESAPVRGSAPAVPKHAGPDYITGVDGLHDLGDTAKLPARLRPPVQAEHQQMRRKKTDTVLMDAHARPSMAANRAKGPATIAASGKAAVPGCSTATFASATGSALVAAVKASTTDCINTLYGVTGADASSIFRESQMVSVASAVRSGASSYMGDNSGSMAQLVMFLRAGYYVQYYDAANVGAYGPAMVSAIQGALDPLFANSHAFDVTDANGEMLSEAVTLIDSSEQNARYLSVVKRLLNGYNASYNTSWWMLNAVNNTYTVLFRGHQVPAFVQAVAADRSVLDTLYNFASSHKDLLGGQQSYLTSNAGRELGRFLQDASIRPTVKPLVLGLLNQSSITGQTAALWVGLAEMTDSFDKAACAYYGTCDLSNRLIAAVLKSNYTCSSSIRILAQDMTAAELSNSCTSLKAQDAYFHSVARDNGPVANDYNTTIEVVVFDSSTDYQTYAGAMYGIDTNNGGMYLEGDPALSGNQPRFIAYEAEWVRPVFQVWNLNHEYTHYLDGRFDMYGDFGAGISTPTIWWIEGFAEFISYSYRGEAYTAAMTEAGKRTYSLRTLFDTSYNDGQTRIYNWGYLASRFMLSKHPNEMATILGYYRTGNWAAARTYLTSTIGTRYDGEFNTFLAACATGDCGTSTLPTPTPTPTPTTTTTPTPTPTTTTPTPGNNAPTAAFTSTVNALQVNFTDGSSDSDGTIASRRWDFGDGTTSTAVNPSKTYTTAGTYPVALTVTDDKGATATVTNSVTVGGSTNVTECTDPDLRALGKNCSRSNRSATAGDADYMFVNIPAGTTRLTITTSGGTGNANLYYNPYSWATPSSHYLRSTRAANAETLVINNPPAGYNYITLSAKTDFSGVTITTKF